MKILVIGGSYFLGKAFVRRALCKGHDVTLVNRGSRQVSFDGSAICGRLTCFTADRHDTGFWKKLPGDYDVIADFCGYAKGDIRLVFDNAARLPERYVFVSTVDVYRRQTGTFKTESAEYEDRLTPEMGEAASYICGKIALEKELMDCCLHTGTDYMILRPAVIYGADNYAPRESLFIRYMTEAGILPMVVGAEGQFQMVYVEDVAEAVLRSCSLELPGCDGEGACRGECINICSGEITTYDTFFDALRSAYMDASYKEIHMNVRSAVEQGAPLPFPVTAEESELCSGSKSERLLGMKYVKLADGLSMMRGNADI